MTTSTNPKPPLVQPQYLRETLPQLAERSRLKILSTSVGIITINWARLLSSYPLQANFSQLGYTRATPPMGVKSPVYSRNPMWFSICVTSSHVKLHCDVSIQRIIS